MSLRAARSLIASPALASATWALLRASAPLLPPEAAAAAAAATGSGSSSGSPPSGPPSSLHAVAAVLRSAAARLVFVSRLRTVAQLRAGGGPQGEAGEAGGSRAAFDFIEDGPNGRILVAQPPPGLPVSYVLASVLSRVLGCPHPLVLPLQPLLLPPTEAAQGEVGAEGEGGGRGLALSGAQLAALLPGGWDSRLQASSAAGTPGVPLLASDAALLTLRPLRRYVAGELVAVAAHAAPRAAAPSGGAGGVAAAAAAAAAECRARGSAEGGPAAAHAADGAASSAGGGMVYARVAAHAGPGDLDAPSSSSSSAAASSAGPGVYRLLVEVEPGVVVPLLSTQVFSFKSPASGGANAPRPGVPPPGQPGAAASPASTTGPATAAGAPPAAGEVAAGSAPGAASAAAPPHAALGAVSGGELVAAVRDVLAAAGLPLAPDAEALMGRLAAAREEAAALRAQLDEVRGRGGGEGEGGAAVCAL